MRPQQEYETALALVADGLDDSEIGRRLLIPRRTIRDWRVAAERGSGGRTSQWKGRRANGDLACHRCSGAPMIGEVYAYLLGQYLGDGHISRQARGVYRLRIFCDLRHPGVANEIASAIVAVRGRESVGFALHGGCVAVNSYWKHWPCLFPQHGPGRKHERRIELAPWQQDLAETYAKDLVRGLIHSDGSRHMNVVSRPLRSGVKRYRYARYIFTNTSVDIMKILTDALDRLGVHWTWLNARNIAVSRKDDVAFLDTFVGPKR